MGDFAQIKTSKNKEKQKTRTPIIFLETNKPAHGGLFVLAFGE
jgi:hypothetical protein